MKSQSHRLEKREWRSIIAAGLLLGPGRTPEKKKHKKKKRWGKIITHVCEIGNKNYVKGLFTQIAAQ